MPVFNIAPVNITANVELDSPSTTLSAGITSATIQLTDSAGNTTPAANSNWLKTTGNIKIWGVQRSTDGGATWLYMVASNDPAVMNPAFFIPFGSLTKSGQLPALSMRSSDLVASTGDLVRLAILTDTNIKLGAQITVS